VALIVVFEAKDTTGSLQLGVVDYCVYDISPFTEMDMMRPTLRLDGAGIVRITLIHCSPVS
jgi:hypothetical protein